MWIIPTNSSMFRSAQDMGALISDSQELSELCARSLLWRSKVSQPSTWSKRLKPGTLMSALCSQTLKPSHGSSIVGEWISSQEASLANHLAQPASEQETATLDTCGPTLPTELDAWGTLPLFSWKTSRGSSAASSQAQSGQTQKVRPFSCMSSESWRGWVTRRRQEYSARAKSVRPISESGCLSWVVAPISARQGDGLLMGCLERQSEGKMWLTPATTAGDAQEPLYTATGEQWTGEGRAYRASGMHRTLTLNMQVTHGPQQGAQSNTLGSPQESRWATPYTGTKDHEGKLKHYQRRLKIGRQLSLHGQITIQANEYKGRLNPRWVETLMGLPVGWVMPSCANPWTIAQTSCECSGMELFQQQQSKPLESYGESRVIDLPVDVVALEPRQEFDPAIIGMTETDRGTVLCYCITKLIEIVSESLREVTLEDDLRCQQAKDYVYFDIIPSCQAPNSPLFIEPVN